MLSWFTILLILSWGLKYLLGKRGQQSGCWFFFKLMMYLSDTHICYWRNFTIGLFAIVLFILVTKKEYLKKALLTCTSIPGLFDYFNLRGCSLRLRKRYTVRLLQMYLDGGIFKCVISKGRGNYLPRGAVFLRGLWITGKVWCFTSFAWYSCNKLG